MSVVETVDGVKCHTGPGCRLHGDKSFFGSLEKQLAQVDKEIVRRGSVLPFPEGKVRVGLNKSNPNWCLGLYELSREVVKNAFGGNRNNVLQQYAMNGYFAVNSFLRGGVKKLHKDLLEDFRGDLPDSLFETYRVRALEHIKEIDDVFVNHEVVFDEPQVLYRGIRFKEPVVGTDLQHVKNKFKPGMVVEDKAFMSATVDPDYMAFFGKDVQEDEIPVVYEIVARKGIPMFSFNHRDNPLEIYPGSIQTYEREVLLNRGGKYRVVGVKNVTFEHSYSQEQASRQGIVKSKRVFPVVQLEQLL